jgi:hypothetical protein
LTKTIVTDLLGTIKISVVTYIQTYVHFYALSLVLSHLEAFEIPFLNITVGSL